MSAYTLSESAGPVTVDAFHLGNFMSNTRFHVAAPSRLALCAVALLICATPALAADKPKPSESQATYNRDRAECMKQSGEDRATCLREASAALQESKRGGLTNEQAKLEKNRLARCDSQPAKDRDECVRRMNEGTTSGSVKEGAVVRELRTVVPAK